MENFMAKRKITFLALIATLVLALSLAFGFAAKTVAYAEDAAGIEVLRGNSTIDNASGTGWTWVTAFDSDGEDDTAMDGKLTLNNYIGGPIAIGGAQAGTVEINLVGNSTVTTSSAFGGSGNQCVGVKIINSSAVKFTGTGTLTVNVTAGTGLTFAYGIYCTNNGKISQQENKLLFESGMVNINVTKTGGDANGVCGIYNYESTAGGITVKENAALNINFKSDTLAARTNGFFLPFATGAVLKIEGALNIKGEYLGEGSVSDSNWCAGDFYASKSADNFIGKNAQIAVDMPNGATTVFYRFKLELNDSAAIDDPTYSIWTSVGEKKYYLGGTNDATYFRMIVGDYKHNGYVSYADFTYDKIESVKTGNATVTVPVAGLSPSFTAVSDEPEKYTARVVEWADNETGSILSDTFVFIEGKEYRLKVKFTAAPGNVLSYDNTFTINNQTTWWSMNGLYRVCGFTALAAGAHACDFDESVWEYDDSTHWHPCKTEGCDKKSGEGAHDSDTVDGYVAPTFDTDDATGDLYCSVCGRKMLSSTVIAAGKYIRESAATMAPADLTDDICANDLVFTSADSSKYTVALFRMFDMTDNSLNTEGGDYLRTAKFINGHEYAIEFEFEAVSPYVYNTTQTGYTSTFTLNSNETELSYVTSVGGSNLRRLNFVVGAHTHLFAPNSYVDEVSATCIATGTKGHKDCTVCGKHFMADGKTEISDLTIPKNDSHVYGDWINEVPETCSAAGTCGHYECSLCHKYFDASKNEIATIEIPVDSTAHVYGAWIAEVPATCESEGTKAHKDCSLCGKHFDNANAEITDLSIAKNDNHDLETVWTATADGHYHKCKREGCKDNGKVDFAAHTPDRSEATEENAVKCTVCDYIITPALGHKHNLTLVPGKAAPCQADGKKAYYTCDGCSEKFEDEAGTIAITADIETWGIIPKAHKFGQWIAEVPATKEATGTKAHKDCEFCGKHFDNDGNEITDLTIAKLPSGGDQPGGEDNPGGNDNPGGEVIEPKQEGLSGGAIAGIVIGSVAVVGIGGFAIFWLAIKKESFAELIAAIKGIFKKK